MSMRRIYEFGPATPEERTVYGASRPGYGRQPVPSTLVSGWIDFMVASGIRRVCCLLSVEQLEFYEDLLGVYRSRFGAGCVCWLPIPDFHLADSAMLTGNILPFLAEADGAGEPVVVHCSAGSGRTGHVLAAWLVYRHGMAPQEAADAVVATGRNPYEAEGRHEVGAARLFALLENCRFNLT